MELDEDPKGLEVEKRKDTVGNLNKKWRKSNLEEAQVKGLEPTPQAALAKHSEENVKEKKEEDTSKGIINIKDR